MYISLKIYSSGYYIYDLFLALRVHISESTLRLGRDSFAYLIRQGQNPSITIITSGHKRECVTVSFPVALRISDLLRRRCSSREFIRRVPGVVEHFPRRPNIAAGSVANSIRFVFHTTHLTGHDSDDSRHSAPF